MWAALLPSTAEAASLTQAQVPQLRHAIESLGFVVGDISVGVNPQGANKEKSGNGNGGEQHAARLTSDPKSGEIFFTEEVG
jgi:flagellar hook-length control protein FliK